MQGKEEGLDRKSCGWEQRQMAISLGVRGNRREREWLSLPCPTRSSCINRGSTFLSFTFLSSQPSLGSLPKIPHPIQLSKSINLPRRESRGCVEGWRQSVSCPFYLGVPHCALSVLCKPSLFLWNVLSTAPCNNPPQPPAFQCLHQDMRTASSNRSRNCVCIHSDLSWQRAGKLARLHTPSLGS